MPNIPAIQRLEHRLLELGCPANRARDKLLEIADHYEDLKLQALTEGFSEAEAESRADRMLGEPVTLANGVVAMLRHSSWWGRHRIIGFCLLPPLGAFAASLVALLGVFGLLRLFFSANQWAILAEGGKEFHIINQAVQVACYAVTASVAVLFCWLARRSIAGVGWAILACALCSLQGYFGYYNISPHAVRLGYSISPNWAAAAIPLAVALGALALHRRLRRRSRANIMSVREMQPDWNFEPPSVEMVLNLPEWRNVVLCPTYWAVGIGVLLVLLFAAREFRAAKLTPARNAATLHTASAGLSEQAGLTQDGKRRPPIPTNSRFKTIELRHFVNTPLVEWIGSPLPWTMIAFGEPGRHQTDLPSVTHLIGGIPFDIQGEIQFQASPWADSDQMLPHRVQGIQIGRKCRKIHVLHGAAFGTWGDDTTAPVEIAALRLHYSDGSFKEVGIFSGGRLLHWVAGPIPKSYVSASETAATALKAESAREDEDRGVRLQRPEKSLRVYQSSFDNPQPQLQVRSIDYLSMSTEASPFLLGLTVE